MPRFRYPLDSFTITQGFGDNPAYYAQYGQRGHNGYDLANTTGTPVYASSDGMIDFEGWGQYSSWMGSVAGICAIVNHGDIRTGYAHMTDTVVNKGQKVAKGQLIGHLGSTGAATGPHTHFEFIGSNFNNGFAGRINPNQFDLGAQGGDDMIDQNTLTLLYREFLGRDPEPEAISHYVGKYTTSFVVTDLLNSQEHALVAAHRAADKSSLQAQLADTQNRLSSEVQENDALTKQLQAANSQIEELKKTQGGIDTTTKETISDIGKKTNWIVDLLSSIFNRSK